MLEIIKSKLISRRKSLRLLGLTVAFGVATSVGVMTSASTAGAGEASGLVRHLNEPHRSATQLSRAITDRVTTFGPAFCGLRGN